MPESTQPAASMPDRLAVRHVEEKPLYDQLAGTEPERNRILVGTQACGCMTYFNSNPDELRRSDERAMSKILRNGGEVETVDRAEFDELVRDPNFMPVKCPHDPAGWPR